MLVPPDEIQHELLELEPPRLKLYLVALKRMAMKMAGLPQVMMPPPWDPPIGMTPPLDGGPLIWQWIVEVCTNPRPSLPLTMFVLEGSGVGDSAMGRPTVAFLAPDRVCTVWKRMGRPGVPPLVAILPPKNLQPGRPKLELITEQLWRPLP